MKPQESFVKQFYSPQTFVPTENSVVQSPLKSAKSESSISLSKSVVTERITQSQLDYDVYYYQVRGNKIIRYPYIEFRQKVKEEEVELYDKEKKKTYQGDITPAAAIRLKKKIQIWYDGVICHNQSNDVALINEHRMFVFLTVTLSSEQIHTDQEIKKQILKPFIRQLREHHNIRNYIWKAESQANGNIHFHFILDRYVKKETIQLLWNKCQNRLGYVDRFRKKFNHCHPPSTKIEAARTLKGLLLYFEKYIVKNSEYRKIEGAVWKGSQGVMSLRFFEFVGDQGVEQLLIESENEGKVKVFRGDKYAVFATQNCKISEIIPFYINSQRDNYYKLLDRFLFSDEIVYNFRDFCYLFESNDNEPVLNVPFICKESYPLPVQLTIWDLKDISNTLKYR